VATPTAVDDHGMTTVNNPRITLELEPGVDPIRGSIEHADGSRQPFWGWLELSAELRRLTAQPEAQAKRPQPDTTTKEQP
jgi:hypothetical protein